MNGTYRLNEWMISVALEPVTIHHAGREFPAQGRKVTGKGRALWLIEYEPRLWNTPKGKAHPPFGEKRQFLVLNHAGKLLGRGDTQEDALRVVP